MADKQESRPGMTPCMHEGAARSRRALAVLIVCLAPITGNAAGFTMPTWHLNNNLHANPVMKRNTATPSFVGAWANQDRNTRGITRLEITGSGGAYRVHAWGRCHPTDCDWGSADAVPFGRAVDSPQPVAMTASFHLRTGETTLVLHLQGNRLTAEALARFDPAQAAGRANYAATYQFVRTRGTSRTQASAGGTGNTTVASPGNAGGAKGRFRVVVTGFTVNHETYDDALQRDGKGDEVYVFDNVVTLNPQGRKVDAYKLRTRTMGDTNGWRGRLRAGTRSRQGGLESGDQYPSSNPWRFSGRTYTDRLPELVWHGTLAQGGDTVVITPAIWEWDKTGNDFWSQAAVIPESIMLMGQSIIDFPSEIASLGSDLFSGGKRRSSSSSRKTYPGCIKVRRDNTLGDQTLGRAETRPIGMKMMGGWYRFCPDALVLNYDKAVKLAQTSRGYGKGIIKIDYKDSSELGGGSYTLYLAVQRY